ncbi:hypothetical protein [Thalassobellus citreus]|uniref:hypothetical protein n=1 Tax=Thalassobellus citreus TaxID=3367752 RepID=UPI0037AF1AD0
MKTLKYIFRLTMVLLLLVSCTEDDNDLSFINEVVAPTEVSAIFNITQDNTGLVTITPNAVGASNYNITYGDGSGEVVNVVQGESISHTYVEGTYPVIIEAVGLTGLKTEITKELLVSFKAPENLEVKANIDSSNPFVLNVSATADYAASFLVFFDTSNVDEVGTPLELGDEVSFEYPAVGDYTIKVVALSGGTESSEITQDITISKPTKLPIDFEIFDSSVLVDFGGASIAVVDNPDTDGNLSSKVAKIVKNGPEVWAGNVIITSAPIDFSTKKLLKMDVWSPRPGGKVLLKMENLTDNKIFIESEATTVRNGTWEEVVFDLSAIDVSQTFQKIVLFFDFGTVGTGDNDWTFYIDNIKQISDGSGPSVLPINFETPFELSSFDGGDISIIENPDTNGNPSTMVAKMVKGAGQVWAGSKITVENPFEIEEDITITAKVWSPRAGLNLLMKFEDATPWPNTKATAEVTATTTTANAWEEVTFTMTGVEAGIDYVNLVLIMDNGTVGDGTDNYTIYVDDISVVSFLDFEPQQDFSSFDGGEISVIANPDTNGNPSSMVAQLVKGAGQVWAGSKITVGTPFSIDNSTTITVKVWSPRAGLNLLMKFEDATPWPNTKATAEVTATTTTANAWEELTFTLTGVEAGVDYVNLVLIMDNGTAGDGTANYTIYIDDIQK